MMAEKETGGGKDLSDDVIYKIDISANRYDLLCVEGLAQAFRVFLGMFGFVLFCFVLY